MRTYRDGSNMLFYMSIRTVMTIMMLSNAFSSKIDSSMKMMKYVKTVFDRSTDLRPIATDDDDDVHCSIRTVMIISVEVLESMVLVSRLLEDAN